ncbi:MAG: cytochrome c [Bacteroidales bacterium]|nr:cytochrome c [Bacteroidales bacterium]
MYPLKPRPLSSGNAIILKDGEIYHSITLGFGSMGAHGPQILPVDRWNVVLYIRSLQNVAKGQLTPNN